uniref:Uncharacterized protein n=1 Tax=Oryza rufipogon TaxID=4529 RepID=A0A0E0PWU5_ORYRU
QEGLSYSKSQKVPHRVEEEPVEIWQTVQNLIIGVSHLPIKEENQLLECTLTLVHAHDTKQQNSLAVNQELNGINELEVEKKNST